MIVVLYILIYLLLFFLIIQEDTKKNNRLIVSINSGLNLLLLFIIIGSATFNNDWIAYEELFYGIKPTYDLLYLFGFQFFRSLNLTFLDFYLWNQLLIYSLVLFFVTRFTSKYLFLIVIAILVVVCPNLSILLRFYTAVAFFLVAVYNLKVSNNRFIGYLFLLLAAISHFGTIILLGVFLIFKYFNIDRSIKSILIIAFALLFLKEILFGLITLLGIGSFSIYITEEEVSTLKGGLMVALPYLPWMFFVYLKHRKLLKNNSEIKTDKKYVFLYQLSLFPFFLIVLGIYTQIIQIRYVEPFSIVWCTYLFYSLRYEESKLKRFLGGITIFTLILISFYLKYFLPLILIGGSEWLLHYLQILNSNAFEIFSISDFN